MTRRRGDAPKRIVFEEVPFGEPGEYVADARGGVVRYAGEGLADAPRYRRLPPTYLQTGEIDVSKIGEQPAYPGKTAHMTHYEYIPGMTYRQWLIGQVAAGWAATTIESGETLDEFARDVVKLTDAIIARLESEGGDGE